MKSIIRTFSEIYKGVSPVTKYILRYGSCLIVTLIICAFYFFIKAETVADTSFFYSSMMHDSIICIKECMGSIYILPMLYELISIVKK